VVASREGARRRLVEPRTSLQLLCTKHRLRFVSCAQCINKNGKLSEPAEDIRQKLEVAGYISAAYRKAIVDQMRSADAYRIISTPTQYPELVGGLTGWAVGGNGGLAPAPLLPTRHPHSMRCACTGQGALVAVICTIVSLDSEYDQLGATAPLEILVLNERHKHIMTWTRRAGLQPLPRPESLRKLMQMSKADLQAQLKDARLPTTGIKMTLAKRLLGQEA
jgi:hypothetical protein